MIVDADLLARYLRQRIELGESEIYLDRMTAAELRSRLFGAASPEAGSPSGSRISPTQLLQAVLGGEPAPTAAVGETPVTAPPGLAARPAVRGEALRVLAVEAAGCTRCRLHEGRRNVVFGVGNPEADVVVVGEAPGGEEDRLGEPFVGPAGKLLDLMLLSVGFPREKVYICNVLKCRPPNNRDPQQDEMEACSPYLHRQLDLIAPKALLAVGRFAAQLLTGSEKSIGVLRGRVHVYRGTPVVATFHPAFLLRSPDRTREAWQDLQLLREVVDR